jgi:hypothetical protein
MWEAALLGVALLGAVALASATMIVLEEISDLPERIRTAVRGPDSRSLSARVAQLEARLTAAERKLPRPATFL